MTLDMFIPQEFSARVLETLANEHVYAALLTREYEGDLRAAGDSVRINTPGDVDVNSYTKGSTTITVQHPIGATQVLVVDQSKYFAVAIDDIDVRQQSPKMLSKYADRAAWKFADTIDSDVASVLSAGVATGNILTAATSVGTGATDDDAYELLVDLGTKLTESNVPKRGRWVVVPPWFEGVLRKDARFVSFGTSENLSMAKNGMIGTMAGFTVHVSNNVPVANGTDYDIIGGYMEAAAFVQQINKVENYRPQDDFSEAIKGLLLYGRKVLRPTGLVKVVATAA